MSTDPFLLVSLEEAESKELAQAITNKSARKILDFLSKNDSATETEIAKKLKLPLSTVHYNLQALTKANLVVAEEFHYSEKGKEVLHYKLANKIIIIAPKKSTKESFMEKLKGIVPIGLIALATAGVIKIITKLKFGAMKTFAAAPLAAQEALVKTAEVVEEEAAPMMTDAVARGGEAVAGTFASNASNITQNATQNITEPVTETIIQTIPSEPNIALWFLIGAGFVILLLIIWYWFVTRKKKKSK